MLVMKFREERNWGMLKAFGSIRAVDNNRKKKNPKQSNPLIWQLHVNYILMDAYMPGTHNPSENKETIPHTCL